MQGARSAETGMYELVHEDLEHRATPQTAAAVVFGAPLYQMQMRR